MKSLDKQLIKEIFNNYMLKIVRSYAKQYSSEQELKALLQAGTIIENAYYQLLREVNNKMDVLFFFQVLHDTSSELLNHFEQVDKDIEQQSTCNLKDKILIN